MAFLRRLPKSSGKRNVPVWRPSVCLSRHSRVFFLTLIEHAARRILNVTHQRAAHISTRVSRARTHICIVIYWFVSCRVQWLSLPEATPPPGAVDDDDVRENDHKFGRGRHQYADTRGRNDDEVRLNTSGRDCTHAWLSSVIVY